MPALCALAKQAGMLSLVDAVTALGGIELRVDEWGIDAIYSGSQKCLSCVPGLSPVSFSSAAVEKIKSRKTPVQSWFLDQTLVMGYWGQTSGARRSYHHTAPVNALYALHEALRLLALEGLEASWARHARMHGQLRSGLQALGMTFVVEEACRLPQLNAVHIPAGLDDAAIRSRLLNEYNLEIGGGLGALAGKAWRIGLMGYGARQENVALLLGALEAVMQGTAPAAV
jgi:alanine-glyoxylate transaminase/serine-glyoxylate transaminase/serine-pyruvate transaminase